MGWNATTNAKVYDSEKDKWIWRSPDIKEAFSKAADFTWGVTGFVDGYLRNGGLDCWKSGVALEEATGKDTHGRSWTRCKEIWDKSNWNFWYGPEDAWAYLSARQFLKVCAEYDLIIEFNW